MLFNNTCYRKNVSALLVMLFCSPFIINAQIITTMAGTGVGGYTGDGGYSVYATFNNPQGMVMDRNGNLYISDYNNNKIRKIDHYGYMSTIAGVGSAGSTGDGGPASSAKINAPAGITIDKNGNLFFADSRNHKIRRIGTDGIITTVAGVGVAGDFGVDTTAKVAKLNEPQDVAIDEMGNMYIADFKNNKVKKIDTMGLITTVAGTGKATYKGDGGPATAAVLNKPSAVAIAKDGSILISDTYNNCIRRITPDSLINTIAGDGKPGYGGDNGVAGVSQLNLPGSIAVDRDGNIYVADQNNNRVRKLDLSGNITTIVGTGLAGGSGDGGLATEARLSAPTVVAVDSLGSLYIAEGQNRIRYVYMKAVEPDLSMDVFPNPCVDQTNIFLPSKYEEIATIFVMNMEGRLMSRTMAPTNRFVNLHFNVQGHYSIYAVTKHNTWKGKAISIK